MDTFECNANPGRVIGSGTLQKLPDEVVRLDIKAPLAETVKAVLKAAMHTPTHIADKAVEYPKAQDVDGVVSVKGGSTIGLGKAISTRTGLPHLCIPTT
ncbi:uncharacterized protein ATNIH1004_006142 [Aspergillus tanneri]|uniref:Uncharacterized protein n=2 Tax=Aspergillus tanneri TaxID=1220188 RepID=A0A5M9MS94_9EURO|nr:uncharacterized protein ATNIH1004_006142 [Aspergillus tanneri]KAA8647449.1 hypothetical protein ATNIH1004_006142 [Aspergillus tanneri]